MSYNFHNNAKIILDFHQKNMKLEDYLYEHNFSYLLQNKNL